MIIRLLHTSDWHLGKKLYKVSRLPEQEKFLDWLSEIIIQKKIDGLMICGDIFDTPYPPTEALKLYFDFLKKITDQTTCQIFVIAGNHDSGQFLDAPKKFLASNRIHIVGQLPAKLTTFKIANIEICLMPYFRAHEILNLQEVTLDIQEQIFANLDLYLKRSSDDIRILMAHHVFGDYEPSGTEQGLNLSGITNIPTKILQDNFDYVALGHIHRPQNINIGRYAGSPLAFRFSEVGKKSINILEIDQEIRSEIVDIPTFREIKTLITSGEKLKEDLETYIQNHQALELSTLLEVRLHLSSPISGLADYIRQQINGKNIELLSLQVSTNKAEKAITNIIEILPETGKLFDLYYSSKYPDKQLPEDIRQDFNQLLSEVTDSENP